MGVTRDGKSLVPIWSGESDSVRDTIFLAYEDIQRAVVTDRWKLIRYPKIDHMQLFDLDNDPHETRNLVNESENVERVLQMIEQMRASQKQFGDNAPLVYEKPLPKAIDLTGTPREPDHWQPQWIVDKYFD
jgi:arylsulfatase A-like enzyme